MHICRLCAELQREKLYRRLIIFCGEFRAEWRNENYDYRARTRYYYTVLENTITVRRLCPTAAASVMKYRAR